MGGVLVLRFAMLCPRTALHIISCDSRYDEPRDLESQWRARLAQFRAKGVENLARATMERWLPDPCEQSIKENALGQTIMCTLEGYDICAEG
jgi:hypothetical protein